MSSDIHKSLSYFELGCSVAIKLSTIGNADPQLYKDLSCFCLVFVAEFLFVFVGFCAILCRCSCLAISLVGRAVSRLCLSSPNKRALMIRIGFWGLFYYKYHKDPPPSLREKVIMLAPTSVCCLCLCRAAAE